MMRHCMVVHAQYPIGETRVEREAQALLARGHEVDVICLRSPGEPRRSRVDDVEVHRLPVSRRRGRGYGAQLLEYVAFLVLAGVLLSLRQVRRRYDVVQIHNLPDFLVFAAVVPKLMGTPVLLDLHDLMPEFFAARTGGSLRSPLVRLVGLQERCAAAFADHVITVTEEWRQTLISRGVPSEKVSVVMNLADTRIFRRDHRHAIEEQARGGFHVLYHGTFAHRYGVDLLLDAVAQARADIPGLTLTLLGAGELGPALHEQRARLGLTDCVRISDEMVPAADLPGALSAADVGVVPNRSDVFTDGLLPTKLLELVAMGTPVITARTPAIAAYFDGDMVQFFEPGSADDLAKAIRLLATDPDRRRALADNADAFNRKHDWDTTAAAYADLITGVRRRPGSGVRDAPMISGETGVHPDRTASMEGTS
jgi:glycosyltransferase involved in cell wall biosynthesis